LGEGGWRAGTGLVPFLKFMSATSSLLNEGIKKGASKLKIFLEQKDI
jgi:hypothetical protein